MSNKTTMKKQTTVTKQQVEKDILKVAKQFKKEFPNSKDAITRDYYRSHGKYKTEVEKIYGSFKNVVETLFKKEKQYSRDDIDIRKVSKEVHKRYIISAIVPGQIINEKFMQSIFTYCDKNNAELLLLVMRGIKKDDTFSNEVYDKYSKYFITEMTLNSNIKIMDFFLAPQQIISLTGLDRIARSDSVIVAHTKQEIITIPARINSYPHLMYSTGCVTYSNYSKDRIGRIATSDHTMGAIIVEIEDNKIFHIRNTQCDKNNGFAVFGKYYNGLKVSKIKSDYILGDLHIGQECPVAIEKAKEIIKELDSDKIYFNDLFDGGSVNHHEENNRYAQYIRPVHQQSLESELNYLGEFLQAFCGDLKNKEFIVVPSNHDYFVDRWLAEGKFVFSSIKNAKLGSELFNAYLDGNNPIEYYLKTRGYLKNIKIHFATLNEKLNSYGYDILHGHKGIGGAKGSVKSFDKCYGKNVTAHGHSPKRFRSSSVVGTNGLLDQPFIAGSGSGWTHTDVAVYENSTDQMIHKINGKYKLSEK